MRSCSSLSLSIATTALAWALAMVAHAAPITLADNTANTVTSNARSDNTTWRAQGFTTTATDFTLTGVTVKLYKETGVTGTFALEVYSATGAAGSPGTSLAQLQIIDAATITGESIGAAALYTYSGLNVTLAPSTSYYLVNKGLTLSGGNVRWTNTTNSNGVGFPSNYSVTSDGGSSWAAPTQTSFQIMSIQAVPVPEPASCVLALAGLGCGGWFVARRRKRG